MVLSMVSVGEKKEIVELRAKDSVKKHLQSLGFVIGEIVEIISENPSGLILLIKDSKIALNKSVANKIIVS